MNNTNLGNCVFCGVRGSFKMWQVGIPKDMRKKKEKMEYEMCPVCDRCEPFHRSLVIHGTRLIKNTNKEKTQYELRSFREEHAMCKSVKDCWKFFEESNDKLEPIIKFRINSENEISGETTQKIIDPKKKENIDLKNFELDSKIETALVFVHGYANTWETTVSQAAPFQFDLKRFCGLRNFDTWIFNWPSKGKKISYGEDQKRYKRAIPHFKEWIILLLEKYKNVSLVVHSMGNRLVLTSLCELINAKSSEFNAHKSKIRHILFAAPDVDCDKFVRQTNVIVNSLCGSDSNNDNNNNNNNNNQINEPLIMLAQHFYDIALAASKWIHFASRAGHSYSIIKKLHPKIIVMSTTEGGDDLSLNHSYCFTDSWCVAAVGLFLQSKSRSEFSNAKNDYIPKNKWDEKSLIEKQEEEEEILLRKSDEDEESENDQYEESEDDQYEESEDDQYEESEDDQDEETKDQDEESKEKRKDSDAPTQHQQDSKPKDEKITYFANL